MGNQPYPFPIIGGIDIPAARLTHVTSCAYAESDMATELLAPYWLYRERDNADHNDRERQHRNGNNVNPIDPRHSRTVPRASGRRLIQINRKPSLRGASARAGLCPHEAGCQG
jgi:hypothetical protein